MAVRSAQWFDLAHAVADAWPVAGAHDRADLLGADAIADAVAYACAIARTDASASALNHTAANSPNRETSPMPAPSP